MAVAEKYRCELDFIIVTEMVPVEQRATLVGGVVPGQRAVDCTFASKISESLRRPIYKLHVRNAQCNALISEISEWLAILEVYSRSPSRKMMTSPAFAGGL